MTTLHAQIFGSGRPLVALHGIYAHGGRFRALAEEYLPGFAVHALDLRGHGHSPHLPPWSLAQQVQDVLTTMDELDLGRADVLGFSYGGLVAAHLANQAPQRVRGLILMDPAIGLDPAASERGATNAMVDKSFADADEARQWREQGWPSTAAAVAQARAEVDEHLVHSHDGRFRWRCQQAAVVVAYSEMARPAVLPPPGLPSLLLFGTNAGVVSGDYTQACRKAGVRVVAVESGHQLMLERPVETGTAIKDFLAELE
ncbi:putative hydrolase, alpha/beta fold LipV [Rhizocola hellebori]|uniref:Putative hydrolase, alpha/beta fold LipV n=1 Tax=Rhizocola hellebori TaxID=1392758 RepID=A0A8J3Q5H1_9ACTN|nr:alpha/beta hydrolase [Rhizocola hellebori]GIH04126.1 putative hydrolase, alpha/beta fold LipV [Rhizocola hellebori]